MVQFSSLFNTISKNISNKPGKKSKLGVGREVSVDLAKEAKRNELLLTSSGSINTRNRINLASGHSKRGKKGLNNQDRFIVWEEFGCKEDMVFCGVFDGHGPWGHLLAKTVRDLMPPSLLRNWQEAVALSSDNLDLGSDTNDVYFNTWKQSYYKACCDVDQALSRYPGIDSFYSGCTALTLIKQGDMMVFANVGDSRAVLATTSDDGNLIATQITVDLKPNLPYESKRIVQSRGRVYACPDEPKVHRVWMPNGETVEGPGLAVSRAFGDYYIKDFGVISEPEITRINISSRDQFAILATDGVWDVVSNEEAVDIVASASETAEAAKRLVQYAVCTWKQRGRAAVMDDISAVCLFFHHSTGDDPIKLYKNGA